MPSSSSHCWGCPRHRTRQPRPTWRSLPTPPQWPPEKRMRSTCRLLRTRRARSASLWTKPRANTSSWFRHPVRAHSFRTPVHETAENPLGHMTDTRSSLPSVAVSTTAPPSCSTRMGNRPASGLPGNRQALSLREAQPDPGRASPRRRRGRLDRRPLGRSQGPGRAPGGWLSLTVPRRWRWLSIQVPLPAEAGGPGVASSELESRSIDTINSRA